MALPNDLTAIPLCLSRAEPACAGQTLSAVSDPSGGASDPCLMAQESNYSCAALRNDLVYLDGPARGPKRWMMIAPRTKETCLNTIRELKKRVCLSNGFGSLRTRAFEEKQRRWAR